MTIHKWKELEKDFCEGIILGNGASIAINSIFSYPSLLESARKDLINPDIDKIFKYLKTDDFELVLHTLWDVYNINNTLGITDPKIKNAYSEIRTALIRAVEKNHVKYQNVSQHLLAIAAFLKHFKTVISLNYDFIVYWAMLAGNEKWGKNRFKDCFVNNGEFQEDWSWLREPYSPSDDATLIFYPHGNLVLAFDRYGVEKKIARDKDTNNLMDKIRKSWESGDYSPLFVSEGNSEQKLKAIKRSPYLSNVYNYALDDLGEKVVIFGWSMREPDDHILKEILKNDKLHRIAVAVDSEKKEKCDEIKDKIKFYRNQRMSNKKTRNNRDIEVIFFDRASPGCWIRT